MTVSLEARAQRRSIWLVLVVLSAACGSPRRLLLGTGASCGDTSADPQHCGACGHSCLGGACQAGVCQPTIVDQGEDPFAITRDRDHVYWASFSSGAIRRISLGDGATMALASEGTAIGAYHLEVAGGYVYAAAEARGAVVRVSLSDGTSSVLSSMDEIRALAFDGEYAYWSSDASSPDSTIRRLALAGGAVETLAAVGAQMLVRAGDALYGVSFRRGEVFRVTLASGTVQLLATTQAESPWGLAVDERYVYWGDRLRDGGAVMRVSREGGQPEVLARSQSGVHGIAVERERVYWTAEYAGTVMSLIPGRQPEAIASGQPGPKNLVLTEDAVYWTDAAANTVMRVALPGTLPRPAAPSP